MIIPIAPTRFITTAAAVLLAAVLPSTTVFAGDSTAEGHECSLDFQVTSIDGESVDLEDYEGNVVLIVNTASQCGLTGQYAGLQELYQRYQDQGFVIIGFPCNQFRGQEPGSNSEIKAFCKSNYGVTFPMMGKIDVNGENASPIYKHLTSQTLQPAGKGPIKWNFEKFLIDREGHVIHRFAPRTKPDAKALVDAIEAQLSDQS